MNPDLERVVDGFRLVLEGLGIEETPHTRDTARRAAKAWYYELCAGLTQPKPRITMFQSKSSNMVILRAIPVKSLCAHHLLPFYGEAQIAYIPGKGEILGVSKLSRITDYCARRPQVQEELTEQIADFLEELVVYTGDGKENPKGGVGVTIRANHMCMSMRGVSHSGDLVTSALRGVFATNPAARAEFLALTQTGGKS